MRKNWWIWLKEMVFCSTGTFSTLSSPPSSRPLALVVPGCLSSISKLSTLYLFSSITIATSTSCILISIIKLLHLSQHLLFPYYHCIMGYRRRIRRKSRISAKYQWDGRKEKSRHEKGKEKGRRKGIKKRIAKIITKRRTKRRIKKGRIPKKRRKRIEGIRKKLEKVVIEWNETWKDKNPQYFRISRAISEYGKSWASHEHFWGHSILTNVPSSFASLQHYH